MITMVQVNSTVGKSWVRIGLFKEQGQIEITINGLTLNPGLSSDTDWNETIMALKEAVANL